MSDFHLLLEEQIPQLMRYASALTRDADEAAELVEDTVHEALADERHCRSSGDIRVRLLTILHDLHGNPFRQPGGPFSPPQRDPRANLTLSQLDRALGRIPEEQRAVILLIGLEGMSYDDTAAILRIPLGTMRSRLARGRANLRELMGVAKKARAARGADAAHAA
ncbi:MAG TPA: sigma factor-like helix-turn-helix DNA-binding protein [Stellaceae bacterium]|nr:sigma factor-like helix-turn-helix DNA-binding protein [Stellaceae bacterium]